MTNQYVVLRTVVPDPPEHTFRSPESAPTEPIQFSIEREQLSPADADKLAGDEQVALAPDIPVRLIAPLEEEEFDLTMRGNDALAGDGRTAWGIEAVGAASCPWTGLGTTVAVLDTGIDSSHPAFDDVVIVPKDFTGEGDGDRNGHGTHCTGTIAGRACDGVRIGVAPGVARVLVGKILDHRGAGSTTAIAEGIGWAVMNGADVISMSVGFDFYALFQDLMQHMHREAALSTALTTYRDNLRLFDRIAALARSQTAYAGGAVLVAAAGNESRRDRGKPYEVETSLPAAAEWMMSVGALERHGATLRAAPYSNSKPDLVAPGSGVLSAQTGGGLVAKTGTSMATPHVAGVAALWFEQLRASQDGWSGRQLAEFVEDRVRGTALPLLSDQGPRLVGRGLVKCPS